LRWLRRIIVKKITVSFMFSLYSRVSGRSLCSLKVQIK
jgi:hypothetical protein